MPAQHLPLPSFLSSSGVCFPPCLCSLVSCCDHSSGFRLQSFPRAGSRACLQTHCLPVITRRRQRVTRCREACRPAPRGAFARCWETKRFPTAAPWSPRENLRALRRPSESALGHRPARASNVVSSGARLSREGVRRVSRTSSPVSSRRSEAARGEWPVGARRPASVDSAIVVR